MPLKCYNVIFKIRYTEEIEVLANDEDEAIEQAEKMAETWHKEADYIDFDDIEQVTDGNYISED